MVSYHGYWQYQDLVQSYNLTDYRSYPPKQSLYNPNSISGFLNNNKDYSIFAYLFKVVKIDQIADESQFKSTVFVCNDELLRKNLGEEFFMNLDKNSATTLINTHILPRVVNEQTLLGRRVALLDTKNPKSQINMVNNKGQICLNNQAYIISKQINCSNGIIYLIDNLLLPENFLP